jgi:hypothetical protein
VVLCKPDGSVESLWHVPQSSDDRSIRVSQVPGGATGFVSNDQLLIIDRLGRVYGPLNVPKPEGFLRLVRIAGSDLWIADGERFFKLDLRRNGASSNLSGIPEQSGWIAADCHATREGLYFIRDHRITLVDWNGKTADLGPADIRAFR